MEDKERFSQFMLWSCRFAYVDFETPEAKVKAIAMSEKNLDGRRLLIKDGTFWLFLRYAFVLTQYFR